PTLACPRARGHRSGAGRAGRLAGHRPAARRGARGPHQARLPGAAVDPPPAPPQLDGDRGAGRPAFAGWAAVHHRPHHRRQWSFAGPHAPGRRRGADPRPGRHRTVPGPSSASARAVGPDDGPHTSHGEAGDRDRRGERDRTGDGAPARPPSQPTIKITISGWSHRRPDLVDDSPSEFTDPGTAMFVQRNKARPVVAASAWVAPTAQVVGNVIVGEGCVVDYGAVLVSSGPLVRLAEGVVVGAGAVIRSVGGAHRPGFPVHVGAESLVGPLAGCWIGAACYVATGVMVFQGAVVGEGSRLGAGS